MTASQRRFSPLDRLLDEISHGLRSAFVTPAAAGHPNPAGDQPDCRFEPAERDLSEGLMRINHTGEIAAQALYRGQAAVAHDAQQRQTLLRAADEEQDHLLWCQQRLDELGGHISRLAPLWYAASFLIGVGAGIAGDRWSLGFVEETENQVAAHLDDHLQRLPAQDSRSRAIVGRMRDDEARHAAWARASGAHDLPPLVRTAMAQTANLMRFISFRL